MLNTDKLYKELTNDKEINDIPIIYIIRVTVKVISLLSKCMEDNYNV